METARTSGMLASFYESIRLSIPEDRREKLNIYRAEINLLYLYLSTSLFNKTHESVPRDLY